ncbi:heavy-metal-associated domain-containing protein [Geotalea toluenoxydans]|uniref:heavy-metal-associated domain-containing protein n=1 Tax=Geotalea toluenoxydans TaxID=421624 RepID=UPI0006CF3BC5|nr:heavy-metal-associated domain-containing protein [Geotalea toluenoxydans]
MHARINITPHHLVVTLMTLLVLISATSWAATQGADTVTVLNAEKLSCGSCAAKITNALEQKEGVVSVEVDIAAAKVTVWHDLKKIAPGHLASVVTDTGYPSNVVRTVAKDVFDEETGKTPQAQKNAGGGCACCNKNRK